MKYEIKKATVLGSAEEKKAVCLSELEEDIMPVSDTYIADTMAAFHRYIEVSDEDISIVGMMCIDGWLEVLCQGCFAERYILKVKTIDNTLFIEDECYQDIFDFSEERGWTEEQVNYMRYGTTKSQNSSEF